MTYRELRKLLNIVNNDQILDQEIEVLATKHSDNTGPQLIHILSTGSNTAGTELVLIGEFRLEKR